MPDLRGTMTAKGKSVVFGNNPHHPGSQTTSDAPRVRDIEVIYNMEGQEGRVAWSYSASSAAATNEPFA